MEIKVWILVENTTMRPILKSEYGFSALVKVDEKYFLYDTGSDNALLKNAEQLGLPIEKCEGLIISHGHFDHTGAVIAAAKKWKLNKLYAHSNLFAQRYGVNPDESLRDISCVFTEKEIRNVGMKWVKTDSFTEISENVFVSGFVPRFYPYENTGGNFLVKTENNLETDLLPDDMGLIIKHPDGLVIISGCAHAGFLNLMRYAKEKTGEEKILAFIGGTHLMTANRERLKKTVEELKKFQIKHLIPCHCTGFKASAYLLNELGETMVQKGETGDLFEF